VAITPAECETPSGRRLLAKLHDLQAAIPPREGVSKEEIDTARISERLSRTAPRDAKCGDRRSLAGR